MSTLKDRIAEIISDCNRPVKGKYLIFHSREAVERILDEIDKEQKILRPALRWFAGICEEELRKHDYKDGWLDEEYPFYIRRAKANLKSITMNRILTPDPKNRKKLYVIKCCADCANFCMMIAHNLIELLRGEMEYEDEE